MGNSSYFRFDDDNKTKYIYMDIHNWIMDIHNWIMDIHNWIMDIHN